MKKNPGTSLEKYEFVPLLVRLAAKRHFRRALKQTQDSTPTKESSNVDAFEVLLHALHKIGTVGCHRL